MTWWRMALSPMLLVTWAVLGLLIVLVVHVGDVVSRSNLVHWQRAEVEAELVAEDVMRTVARGCAVEDYMLHPGTSRPVSLIPRGNGQFDIGVTLDRAGAGWKWFCGQVLPGALPEVFSYRAAVGAGFTNQVLPGAAAIEPSHFPDLTLDPVTVRFVQSLVVEAEGVARRFIPGGTDGADYVLVSGGSDDAPPSGVLEVDGHCWVPPGQPVRLELDRDLTVIATGNIYLGDHVRVHGVGRLLLVARADRGGVFGDRDGDGIRGPGERGIQVAEFGFRQREGQGAVQFGWPTQAAGTAPEKLRVDGAILAWGEFRAYAPSAVGGPALARCGAVGTQPVTGGAMWTLTADSDGLPGLRTEGGPRPSALRPGRWP